MKFYLIKNWNSCYNSRFFLFFSSKKHPKNFAQISANFCPAGFSPGQKRVVATGDFLSKFLRRVHKIFPGAFFSLIFKKLENFHFSKNMHCSHYNSLFFIKNIFFWKFFEKNSVQKNSRFLQISGKIFFPRTGKFRKILAKIGVKNGPEKNSV